MSIEYMFFDNQQVTAAMMNEAVSKIFTRGVVQITDNENDVPYNITKLNDIYYSNLDSGIVMTSDNTLKVSVEDGKAVINDGTCIFPNGSHATIENTETIELLGEGTSYISLCSDTTRNCVYAQATDTEPTGNVVLLASITDGVVTDLRKYAKGKVASSYASDYGLAGVKTFVVESTYDSKSNTFGEFEPIKFTYDKPINFMMIKSTSRSSYGFNFIDCLNKTKESFLLGYNNYSRYRDYNIEKFESLSGMNFSLTTDEGKPNDIISGLLHVDHNDYTIDLTLDVNNGGYIHQPDSENEVAHDDFFPLTVQILLI